MRDVALPIKPSAPLLAGGKPKPHASFNFFL